MDFPLNAEESLFEWSLFAPLDALVVPQERVGKHGEQFDAWDLPASDRQALQRWGLPILASSRFVPKLQGEQEPCLLQGKERLYALGRFPTLNVGTVASEGRVVGIRLETALPVPLQAIYGPALPLLVFINSSVTQFIECAWRWYWASQGLKRLPLPVFAQLERFWERVRTIDPATDQDAIVSLWPGLIAGW